MKVKDLIKSPVTTCTTSADVGEVRDLMSVKRFSAMPVVELDEEKATLKGIVSYQRSRTGSFGIVAWRSLQRICIS